MLNSAEPTTEAAIHLGLEFLTRYQSPDGSWSLSGFDQDHPQHVSQLNSDTAGTGLALLAFQGAGYNHREFRYARQVKHGLQWLIENQQSNGCLYVPSDEKSNRSCRLYSHGIAALALTEAYGMTQDLANQISRATGAGLHRRFPGPTERWLALPRHAKPAIHRHFGYRLDDDGVAKWPAGGTGRRPEDLFRHRTMARFRRRTGRRFRNTATARSLLIRKVFRGSKAVKPRPP